MNLPINRSVYGSVTRCYKGLVMRQSLRNSHTPVTQRAGTIFAESGKSRSLLFRVLRISDALLAKRSVRGRNYLTNLQLPTFEDRTIVWAKQA